MPPVGLPDQRMNTVYDLQRADPSDLQASASFSASCSKASSRTDKSSPLPACALRLKKHTAKSSLKLPLPSTRYKVALVKMMVPAFEKYD